jgi:small multidrug resistance family-3 protein
MISRVFTGSSFPRSGLRDRGFGPTAHEPELSDGQASAGWTCRAVRSRTAAYASPWTWIGAGVVALGLYGFVATLQPTPHFGRILAAYDGMFVAGSLAWGVLVDGLRPDRYDIAGAVVGLVGVGVIMYAPRG